MDPVGQPYGTDNYFYGPWINYTTYYSPPSDDFSYNDTYGNDTYYDFSFNYPSWSPPSYTSFSPDSNSKSFNPTTIVVGFLALFSIIPCIFVCIKPNSASQVEGDQNSVSNQSPNVLDEETDASPGKVIEYESQGGECIVCLVEYSKGDVLRQLTMCGHSFHKDCIDEWIKSNTSCPICRAPFKLDGPVEILASSTESETPALTAHSPSENQARLLDESSSSQRADSQLASNLEPEGSRNHSTPGPDSAVDHPTHSPSSSTPHSVIVLVSPSSFGEGAQGQNPAIQSNDFVVIDFSHQEPGNAGL